MGKVITALTWVYQMVASRPEMRKEARKRALDSILNYKKGQISKEGEELVDWLDSEFEFIGFVPSIVYIKEDGTKSDLEAQWVHPFSTPTLLYKHKKSPFLVMSNGNLDFNDSRLRKISKNVSINDLKNILGITG